MQPAEISGEQAIRYLTDWAKQTGHFIINNNLLEFQSYNIEINLIKITTKFQKISEDNITRKVHLMEAKIVAPDRRICKLTSKIITKKKGEKELWNDRCEYSKIKFYPTSKSLLDQI